MDLSPPGFLVVSLDTSDREETVSGLPATGQHGEAQGRHGSLWICIDLLELRESKVYRETVYWAQPFDAPSWRAPWVHVEADHDGGQVHG